MLDGLRHLHRLPITPPVFELFNVARTDSEIARSAVELTTVGMDTFRRKAKELLPTYAASAGFDAETGTSSTWIPLAESGTII
ncbi:hypothetical protein NONI108955_14400 [Nocardia ninae]|uniref:Uncharacterized protein n=1 Tax=Nocardia ninae NBRC 108245 TaxID=1210091 RepID=A0A511M4E3_9NOCA|nr:hypothetical protein [Nocardia ninae]GEM35513.1 hypothetical protein NN4_00320 [Nocardia ninae NBRC 108245]